MPPISKDQTGSQCGSPVLCAWPKEAYSQMLNANNKRVMLEEPAKCATRWESLSESERKAVSVLHRLLPLDTGLLATPEIKTEKKPVKKRPLKKQKVSSTAQRRKSNCHYCEPLGENCGLVAGKCPNRPCDICNDRHRLGRCRKKRLNANSKAKKAIASKENVGDEKRVRKPVKKALFEPKELVVSTRGEAKKRAEAAAAAAAEAAEQDSSEHGFITPKSTPPPAPVDDNISPAKKHLSSRLFAKHLNIINNSSAAVKLEAEDEEDDAVSGQAGIHKQNRQYTMLRKRSECHFCKQIGLNCGLVAGKCPNRPCDTCKGRHRHGRCRYRKPGVFESSTRLKQDA